MGIEMYMKHYLLQTIDKYFFNEIYQYCLLYQTALDIFMFYTFKFYAHLEQDIYKQDVFHYLAIIRFRYLNTSGLFFVCFGLFIFL